MVNVYLGDIIPRLKASQPGKRMPLLCALNRSFGWRILSESNEENEKGVRSDVIDLNNNGYKEDYLTAMAVSDSSGVIAIGSGSNEGNLYLVKDLSAVTDVESGPRFKILHKESLGTPIHSLDWSGSHLLLGTNQGISKIYEVEIEEDMLKKFTCIGQYICNPSQSTTSIFSYNLNTHVKSAEFSPVSSFAGSSKTAGLSKQFLTTTLNIVSIWDMHHASKSTSEYQASNSLLNCASWSPNDPQSLIACGDNDKKLSIIDTRVPPSEKNGIVWSVDKSHDRPVRDAKFNPYIPYWLASAGEDSIVNIWDIRASYKAPVAKIDGLLGMVTSVTWSNIRPENIGTTSSDGVMRYWTLSPENLPIWDTHYKVAQFSKEDTLPITREFEEENKWCVKGQVFREKKHESWMTVDDDEGIEHTEMRFTKLLAGSLAMGEWGKPDPGTIYRGEENVPSKGMALALKPAKLRPSMYYCITSGGQLAAHTVRFDAQSNLRNRHRYDPDDKNEICAKIEDDIYCRRISEANNKLEILKNTKTKDEQEENHRLEDVEFLEDCLKTRAPIKEAEWRFDSVPDHTNRRVSRRLWNDEDKWDMAIQTFKTELKHWSYRIPPGFDERYKFPLEFKAPIIAPHLLEKEVVPANPLPSVDTRPRNQRMNSTNDILSQPLSSGTEEDLGNNKEILVYTHPTVGEEVPGSKRSSHTPPVMTINDISEIRGDQEQNKSTSSTTPQLGKAADRKGSPSLFESSSKDANIENIQSTNPFLSSSPEPIEDSSKAAVSTNPFEEDFATPMTSDTDVHLARAHTEIKDSRKRNSFASAGHRLSLTLSRHSIASNITSNTMNEEPKTPAKKHRFNPFKRMLSRNGTTTEEDVEDGLGPIDVKNTTQNDPSSRRNALHGPF